MLEAIMRHFGWVRIGPTGGGALRWKAEQCRPSYKSDWLVVREILHWCRHGTEAEYYGPTAESRAKAHAAALNNSPIEAPDA